MSQLSYIRRAVKQVAVLIALAGLTFAAGIDWAEAATPAAETAVPGAVHVIVLFVLTIGFVLRMLTRPQQRARVRATARRPRR